MKSFHVITSFDLSTYINNNLEFAKLQDKVINKIFIIFLFLNFIPLFVNSCIIMKREDYEQKKREKD